MKIINIIGMLILSIILWAIGVYIIGSVSAYFLWKISDLFTTANGLNNVNFYELKILIVTMTAFMGLFGIPFMKK